MNLRARIGASHFPKNYGQISTTFGKGKKVT
jgi:hypothetical protein